MLTREELGDLLPELAQRAYQVWEDGGEWESLARRRSSLEFLDDLYAGTAYEGFASLLELDELDQVLRERGPHEGFPNTHRTPGGILERHWWWRPWELSSSE